MNATAEVWKPVTGWPYDVSNQGRVRNQRTGNLLKAVAHKSGYLNVQLWNHRRYKTCLVHRLVAFAFLDAPPSDRHEVAHSDGSRHHNAASNLRWALHTENMRDRDLHGTTARGARNGKLKHPDAIVIRARELRASGMKNLAIASALGISEGTVSGYISRTRRPTVALSRAAKNQHVACPDTRGENAGRAPMEPAP